MVDQAYQSIPKPVAAYTPTEVSLCDFLVCIFCLDSQENGLEDKRDPSGKSVQKARWIVATKESPMVTYVVFAGSHGEQEMSGPPHAAGHCLGISTAAICSLVLFWIGLGYAVFFF